MIRYAAWSTSGASGRRTPVTLTLTASPAERARATRRSSWPRPLPSPSSSRRSTPSVSRSSRPASAPASFLPVIAMVVVAATLVHGHPAPAQAKMTLTGMALIHGYTTAFWVAAAIFGAGAVTCGTLFRRGRIPDA